MLDKSEYVLDSDAAYSRATVSGSTPARALKASVSASMTATPASTRPRCPRSQTHNASAPPICGLKNDNPIKVPPIARDGLAAPAIASANDRTLNWLSVRSDAAHNSNAASSVCRARGAFDHRDSRVTIHATIPRLAAIQKAVRTPFGTHASGESITSAH